jgi:hypothetical protein
MPLPVVGGFIAYLSQQLTQELNQTIWVYDGETPRFDGDGNPVVPSTVQTGNWPRLTVKMPESGFQRSRAYTSPYKDIGTIQAEVEALSREQSEGFLSMVEAILAVEENWRNIPLGTTPVTNPPYVVDVWWARWWSVEEEYLRTMNDQLLYRSGADLTVTVHGALATFGQ